MPYDNSNSGVLYRNDRKQQPNHPDFTGQCEVGGVAYWLSAWTKEAGPQSKTPGKRFFSLSFKPKDEPRATPPPMATPAGADDDMEPTPIPATERVPPPEKPKSKIDEELDLIPF